MSLKCSMDIQSSDGRSLLLKYVSSYVSKMKDHQVFKGLSVDKTSFIKHKFYIIDNKIVKDIFTYNISHWTSAWMFPSYSNSITIIVGLFHIEYFLNKFGVWCRTSSFEFWYVLRLIFVCVTLLSDIDIHDVSGYSVGTQYLQNLSISSADMTQYLCNIKMSGTNCIPKKYRAPFFNYVLNDKIVLKYMDRPAWVKSLTLTEYSRYLQNNFLQPFSELLSYILLT